MGSFYRSFLYVLPTLVILSESYMFPHARLRRSVEIERQTAAKSYPTHHLAKREEKEVAQRQSGMEKNAVIVPENDAPLAISDGRHFHPSPTETFLVNNKAKMGNNTGAYNKKQAVQICNLFYAQLATQQQLSTAWLAGAEWCWYGHVVEALLALPVTSPDMVAKCPGHDGKKGARVVEYVTEGLSGATCYGIKPARNATMSFDGEELTVLPFNPKKWSQFSDVVRHQKPAQK